MELPSEQEAERAQMTRLELARWRAGHKSGLAVGIPFGMLLGMMLEMALLAWR